MNAKRLIASERASVGAKGEIKVQHWYQHFGRAVRLLITNAVNYRFRLLEL